MILVFNLNTAMKHQVLNLLGSPEGGWKWSGEFRLKKYVDKREMFAYIQNIGMNIIGVQEGTCKFLFKSLSPEVMTKKHGWQINSDSR